MKINNIGKSLSNIHSTQDTQATENPSLPSSAKINPRDRFFNLLRVNPQGFLPRSLQSNIFSFKEINSHSSASVNENILQMLMIKNA